MGYTVCFAICHFQKICIDCSSYRCYLLIISINSSFISVATEPFFCMALLKHALYCFCRLRTPQKKGTRLPHTIPVPPCTAPDFTRVVKEKDQGETVNKIKVTVFDNLILKVTSYHFCHTTLMRSESQNQLICKRRGLRWSMRTRKQGSLGPCRKTPTTNEMTRR